MKQYLCEIEIGCDGNETIGELRPVYEYTPEAHFNNILKLIKDINNIMTSEEVCYDNLDLSVVAGTGYDIGKMLGGHIHIGYDPYKVEEDIEIDNKVVSYVLSVFAGTPLMLIEKKEERLYRCRNCYGCFRDYDDTTYGLEWRMPSSWLVSPEITMGALTLTYTVAYEIIKYYNEYKTVEPYKTLKTTHIYKIKKFRNINLTKYDIYFLDRDIDSIKNDFNELTDVIRDMELYLKYKDYIEYILKMVENNKTWNSEVNILESWKELL
jgi:hypothetical protein